MPEVGPIEETYYPQHFVYKHITTSDTTNQDLRQFFREVCALHTRLDRLASAHTA